MPRKQPEIDLGTLAATFSDKLQRAVTRPTVFNYRPHPKQLQFHKGQQQQKLYIGGNRSGKTVGGIVEDVHWLRGQHPYRKLPMRPGEPCRGRIVTVSFTEGIKQIIIPEISKWLPPSDLINGSWEDSYNKNERLLTMANGATCELMSYDQDVEKFAGTSRHFVHFDEEPPKAIWNECKMRLLDTAGSWWMTMTPVEGMTWVYDDIFTRPSPHLLTIVIDTEENPYITQAQIDIVLEGLDENERKARKEGKFVQLGGLALTEFNPEIHVIQLNERDPQADYERILKRIYGWTQYASMDHGISNPTAWLWHAVSPSGAVVTFDELYDNERLVNDYAVEIHQRNALPYRRPPEIYVGDPAIKQRNGQTGDSIQTAYSMAGVPIVLGNNDVRIGIDKMNRYFKGGKWVIIETCHNLIRENQRLRWKTYETAKKRHDNNPREELHKKNDHAPDSARYFFSMMPDLVLPKEAPPVDTRNMAVKAALSARTVPVGPHYIDTNLLASLRSGNRPTEWVVQDEHMGGLY
jgi:phage terminase large subunit-like protein